MVGILTSKRKVFFWITAILTPFVMIVFVPNLLHKIFSFNHFFDRLPFFVSITLISIILVAPSYVLLALKNNSWQSRYSDMIKFSLLLIIIIPAVWFWGLYASCIFFNHCL